MKVKPEDQCQAEDGQDGESESHRREGSAMIVISGKIEEEISKLEPQERIEFLAAMNLTESGLDQLAREGHKYIFVVAT